MVAGRKPKPPALKLVEGRGNGRDSGGRKVKEPPSFVRLPPEPPEILNEEALAEWNRVVPELQRLKLTKSIDAAALTAYCLAWSRMVTAQRIIDSEGILHSNSQGVTRHPAVAVLEAASKELRSWCAEFGLTPSAENRLATLEANDGEEANPFAGA
jgi:P27 family predicted phage terminase small subunit